MPIRYEEPTRESEGHRPGSSPDAYVERHPAYAQIGASRVSGYTNLYGSDFEHHEYITVRINASALHRDLSHDRFHPGREYIEVALSEAQWARFISALNVGEGAPCTLQALGGQNIPQIPEPPKQTQKFEQEVGADLQEALDRLDALRADIATCKAGVKERERLVREVDGIKMQFTSSVPFVAQSFSEHVERTKEQAKVEIDAYVQNTIARAGLAGLRGEQPPIELPAGGPARGDVLPGTGAALMTAPGQIGGHFYPGCVDPKDFFTSHCANGCGCWMGGTRSGGPDGVNPFGDCPGKGAV